MKVASLTTFQTDPASFYAWLHPLMQSILAAKPNKAHFALAKLAAKGIIKTIITQNIDFLHQRAGTIDPIEVHGSLEQFECIQCHTSINYQDDQIKRYLLNGAIPKCPDCKRVLKPAITLFEEMLPINAWEKAYSACAQADLVIAVGTSLEVYPVNLLPELALKQSSNLIINTLSSTHLDKAAAVVLPYDVIQVWQKIQAAFD